MRKLMDCTYSRVPVFEDTPDKIIGILHLNHFYKAYVDSEKVNIRELLLPVTEVHKTKPLPDVLEKMKETKSHMVVVLDEYGGTSGLVTMEDLLEEIVGNIYDETDPLEAREITEREPGVFRVAGHCDLDVLRERLGVDIPENDEIDTLSGLIINEISNVPEDGSTFDIDLCGMHVHVDEAGHEVLAGGVDDARPLRGIQALPHRGDLVAVDEHVTDVVEAHLGVDDVGSLKQIRHCSLLPEAGTSRPCA